MITQDTVRTSGVKYKISFVYIDNSVKIMFFFVKNLLYLFTRAQRILSYHIFQLTYLSWFKPGLPGYRISSAAIVISELSHTPGFYN